MAVLSLDYLPSMLYNLCKAHLQACLQGSRRRLLRERFYSFGERAEERKIKNLFTFFWGAL